MNFYGVSTVRTVFNASIVFLLSFDEGAHAMNQLLKKYLKLMKAEPSLELYDAKNF